MLEWPDLQLISASSLSLCSLGMRHDTKENSCDPSLHIMSPTLGSGKITWSKCSRTYLDEFLA